MYVASSTTRTTGSANKRRGLCVTPDTFDLSMLSIGPSFERGSEGKKSSFHSVEYNYGVDIKGRKTFALKVAPFDIYDPEAADAYMKRIYSGNMKYVPPMKEDPITKLEVPDTDPVKETLNIGMPLFHPRAEEDEYDHDERFIAWIVWLRLQIVKKMAAVLREDDINDFNRLVSPVLFESLTIEVERDGKKTVEKVKFENKRSLECTKMSHEDTLDSILQKFKGRNPVMYMKHEHYKMNSFATPPAPNTDYKIDFRGTKIPCSKWPALFKDKSYWVIPIIKIGDIFIRSGGVTTYIPRFRVENLFIKKMTPRVTSGPISIKTAEDNDMSDVPEDVLELLSQDDETSISSSSTATALPAPVSVPPPAPSGYGNFDAIQDIM